MPLLSDPERAKAEALARLAYVNPFLPERVECEREILGRRYQAADAVWHWTGEPGNPNLGPLAVEAEALVATARRRLAAGRRASPVELALYADVALYALYQRYERPFFEVITGAAPAGAFAFFERFARDWREVFGVPAAEPFAAAHGFACFFQVRRAFHFTHRHILGGSLPAARLRAQVWQSIFTHDLKGYLGGLFRAMGDQPTLVTGPSGTGKELVARAIGLARYLPFDPGAGAFAEDFREAFFPLNLAALSPTLIESELFGHRRGSFTGAVEDRAGWLELCPPLGTVFLDEIAEVEPAIQVKLLRVLETRAFARLGETRPRAFRGKVVAATNRDLASEMRRGRFREDLYYRLCADAIRTPTLAERLADSPGELRDLALHLAAQMVGPEQGERLASQVVEWVERRLGPAYPWPGNVRELAQCVRNVLIRREYHPPAPPAPPSDPGERLAAAVRDGRLTADELLGRYTALVYARSGSYLETARRLGLDRRTVKARLSRRLAGEAGPRSVAATLTECPPPGG